MKPDWCPDDIWLQALHVQDNAIQQCEAERLAYRFPTCNGKAVLDEHIARALLAARADGMEIAAGETRDMRPGLSAWEGWDQSRLPWSECKHKDAVLEALFEGPWSMEDADALIGFIDRTWGPAAIRTAALDMRRGERE